MARTRLVCLLTLLSTHCKYSNLTKRFCFFFIYFSQGITNLIQFGICSLTLLKKRKNELLRQKKPNLATNGKLQPTRQSESKKRLQLLIVLSPKCKYSPFWHNFKWRVFDPSDFLQCFRSIFSGSGKSWSAWMQHVSLARLIEVKHFNPALLLSSFPLLKFDVRKFPQMVPGFFFFLNRKGIHVVPQPESGNIENAVLEERFLSKWCGVTVFFVLTPAGQWSGLSAGGATRPVSVLRLCCALPNRRKPSFQTYKGDRMLLSFFF